MLVNRCLVIIVSVLVVTLISAYAWANCHQSSSCENVMDHMVSLEKWILPDDNHVRYYLNSQAGYPPLANDVTYGANQWSRVPYNNGKIRFKISQLATTNLPALRRDNFNVVGWTSVLPWGENNEYIIAEAWIWSYEDDWDRIEEADIGLNYYAPLDRHGHTDDTEYCIRNVATHEFGHWVKFWDLLEAHNCAAYEEYTMWGRTYVDESKSHKQETLECEDKWGLWKTYGLMPEDN